MLDSVAFSTITDLKVEFGSVTVVLNGVTVELSGMAVVK